MRSEVSRSNTTPTSPASVQGVQSPMDRRRFLGKAGMVGLGAVGFGFAAASPAVAQTGTASTEDSVIEIVSTLLIAEDLATTFYYNVLVGQVIQVPQLAGSGGTALNPSSGGIGGNVKYMRSAFYEEATHASLLRGLVGAAPDNSLTFYFPEGTFDTLLSFADTLATLENAFIGAYLNAIQLFAQKAAAAAQGGSYTDVDGTTYSAAALLYAARLAASIMGVECEHRILGRVISDMEPGDNVLYEQTDGLTSVFSGSASALHALTPFLTASTGPGYAFSTARANLGALGLVVNGQLPAQ